MTFNSTTGFVTGEAVQQSAEDTTAGRLMRADYGFSRGNILGNVSEISGVPTGALIEQGTTSTGECGSFTDGTQICWCTLRLLYTGSDRLRETWTFPASFSTKAVALNASLDDNCAPDFDEICGIINWNTTRFESRFLQYRVSGQTNFQAGDFSDCDVLAVGPLVLNETGCK